MKKSIFYALILLGLLSNCDSNGQTKKKQLTQEEIQVRNARRLDSLDKLAIKEIMKTDALYKKMEGTWVFKQIQNCELGNCLFNGTGANGICDKLKITFTHKVDKVNGVSYADDKYVLYYLRLPVKDGVILDDKEIGDGSKCGKNQGLFREVLSSDKKTKYIQCSAGTVDALYNDCFRWDPTKEALYSDYTFKICGNPCHITGYWVKEQ